MNLEQKDRTISGIILLLTLGMTFYVFSDSGGSINLDGKKRSASSLLSYKNISTKDIVRVWPEMKKIDSESWEQIIIESQYSGYLKRQNEDIKDFEKDEELRIPQNINYKKVGSLSNEVVEKLSLIKPPTLGAASRISGVTPAAVIALLRHVKRKKNQKVI